MAPNNTHPEAQTGQRPGAGALLGGTLFIVLITACAMIIAYNGLFALAEYGGGESTSPHVFPVAYTLLVLMAFWVSYMLRDAAPRDRLWIDVGLIPFLIVFAAIVMVMHNMGMFDPETGTFPERAANVIVAVAPLVPILIAILLWITVRAHLRRRSRAVRRPSPSADRTTVLHGRRPAQEEVEPASLQTRLLSFGNRPEDDGNDEDGPDTEEAVSSEASSTHLSEPPARNDELDAPTTPPPLPRRSRDGSNPIKHAAEHPPVVPGAATPTSEPPEEGFSPDVVFEESTDEGFEHEPAPGDPVTDEAEAPAVPTEVRTAPETLTEPEEEDDTGPEEESDTEPGPTQDSADESPFASWEPPTEDRDEPSVLADYVPPVWTPPEEETSSPPAEQAPTATPSLDHDTGPEVRAAFHRMDSAPTPPEEDDGDGDGAREGEESAPLPEVEELPSQRTESSQEPTARPATSSGEQLRKRPMMLKPPRPPLPDFESGPPSRRVRSEPLRPED